MLQLRRRYPAPRLAGHPRPRAGRGGCCAGPPAPRARFEVGDRVMGIVGGGGQANWAVVHERQLMPVPDAFDWVCRRLSRVFDRSRRCLHPGPPEARRAVACAGGAGGVGTAAIQLGAAVGFDVTATVRDESKQDAVEDLGAVASIPRASPIGAVRRNPRARRCPQSGGQPPGAAHGRPDRGDRHRGRSQGGELNLALVMSPTRQDHGLDVACFRPLEEKALTLCGPSSGTSCRSWSGVRRASGGRGAPLDRVAEAYERFQAGGKLGKIVV